MKKRLLVVPEAHADRRLDKFLLSQHKGVPKSLIFRMLRTGAIRVNGRKAKPDLRTTAGDEISLPPLEVEKEAAPQVPEHRARAVVEAIVYEDEDLLVVDKDPGVPVHTGTGHAIGLIEALRAARPHQPDLELAHRIDADTSGAVVVAKSPAVLRSLQEDFAEERVTRRYLALVGGAWPRDLARVDAPLIHDGTATVVSPQGAPATTHFRIRARLGTKATLLDTELGSGRKHQIRAHTAHAGHPILGDRRYGGGRAPRLMLHAAHLVIPRPRRSPLSISVSPDRHFTSVIDGLRPGRRRRR